MRIEKTFLLNEISDSVKSSEYVYLVDFGGVKVDEISELRKVGEGLSWPSFTQWLHGQTGIVFGGDNPTGVAKLLVQFAKDKGKLPAKGGLMDGQLYDTAALEELSKLPDLPTLRATFLSLLLTPYRRCLYVLQGVPQALLNVLQAKSGN